MARYDVTAEDVRPLIEGLAILGTGGGGSPIWGTEILENDLEHGRTLTLVDPDDVEDDAFVISGGYMGSVKSLDAMSFEDIVAGWEQRFELLEVIKVTEALLNKKVNYVVPFEVGALNTPVIMSACARLGIPCVNGDALGRAAPETQMTSFIGHGISLTPMPLVDRAGNVVIVKDSVEPTYADELGRWVVTRGGGTGANNHYPMSGRDLKRVVIPKTVTLALQIGRALKEARSAGKDPVQAVATVLGGKRLFSGKLEGLNEEDKGGFLHTSARIAGTGDFQGSTAELTIKNEVMLCRINGQIRAIFPDLVCMLDPQTGSGTMSADLSVGTPMVLLGIPCHPRLREAMKSEIGARAMGGARYGHPDVKYRPIEDLAEKS